MRDVAVLVAAGMPKSVTIWALAKALVGRIPDHVAVLERLDEGAHVVARNRAPGLHCAARVQEFPEQQILRRAIHDIERHARGERAATDLDGIEVGGEQQYAAPGRVGRLEMLEAVHQRDAADALVR